MKNSQHLVPNNFCVYIFLFFFLIDLILCFLTTHLFLLTNDLMDLECPRTSLSSNPLTQPRLLSQVLLWIPEI